MRLSKNDKMFIELVKNGCKKHKVSCKLKDVNYLKPTPTIRCTGYFDDESRTLQVAMKQRDAFEILVHEYSHLTQWIDKVPVYTKANKYLLAVDEWIAGTDLPEIVIDTAIQGIVDLELDNEKRSAKLIDKYGLSVDKESYVKKANAYLYFYHWMRKTRKWCSPNNPPYRNKNIVAAMPTTFRGKYNKLPKRFEKVFEQENI
jgi:hypothetical protein